jgi:ABC-type multidrug transport system fused ATPase/permease subunit
MKSDAFLRVLADVRELHRYLPLSWSRQSVFWLLNLTMLLLQLPTPFVVSRIINTLASGNGLLDVWPYVVTALLLMLTALVLSSWIQFDAWRQNVACAQALRIAMYDTLLRREAGVSHFNKHSDLHARLSNDVAGIVHLWPTGFAFAARHLLTITMASAALLYISLELTLCIAIFLPLAVLTFRQFGKRMTTLAQKSQAAMSETNGVLLESLAAHDLALASGTATYHKHRLQNSMMTTNNRLEEARLWGTWMGLVLGVLPQIITGIIWIMGGMQLQQAALTAGDLVAFVLILSILYGPIQGLFSTASSVIFEGAALARVMEILRLPVLPEPARCTARPMPIGTGAASMKVQGLNFARENQTLFSDLTLDIPAGSIVAIHGDNGVGKSTLISLLFGVHPAHMHHILLNGQPMSSYPSQERASLIAYLPQDVLMFSDSLRNNITLGRAVTDQGIWDLARQLHLESFLQSWPGQLDAHVEEGGHNLSGGERQRIGLLRVLISKPAILLMDEPEQNLDQQSLQGLLQYLEQLKHHCTCVLVTHSDTFAHLVDQRIDLSALAAGH